MWTEYWELYLGLVFGCFFNYNDLFNWLFLCEEEQAKKKKKKPVFELRKEKRLQYYSGWGKDDKAVDKGKVEEQKRLI